MRTSRAVWKGSFATPDTDVLYELISDIHVEISTLMRRQIDSEALLNKSRIEKSTLRGLDGKSTLLWTLSSTEILQNERSISEPCFRDDPNYCALFFPTSTVLAYPPTPTPRLFWVFLPVFPAFIYCAPPKFTLVLPGCREQLRPASETHCAYDYRMTGIVR